jgi:predicted ATPase
LPLQGNATEGNAVFLNDEGEPIPTEELRGFLQGIKYTKLHRGIAPTAKELFLGEGKTGGDKSRSGYDFALAQKLLAKDLPPNLAREILLGKPEGTIHSQDEEYLDRTLQKAERVESTQEIPTRSWNDIVPIMREEFFAKLSEKLIIGEAQRQQLDIFYATIIANLKTSGRPIWLLIVGPPGCGKTMPMAAVQHSPFTYACSAFRPTALISGWGTKGGQDMSLLPKLNGKILMVKDMSSLLSQNKDVVLEIMGLLRDAYDGYCSRVYGTGVERSYKSRFGFIGAATPDIDMHWSLNVRLGERFLRLRVKSTLDQIYGKIDLSLDNIKEEDNVDNVLEETSLGYLKYLTRDKAELPALAMQKSIGRLAQLGAILRTSVARHAYSRQVLVIPEWEEATRYAKQLAKVAMSLAFIRDKETNDEEEMDDLKKLVRSCIDAKMEKLYAEISKYPKSTSGEISARIGRPSSMIRNWMEDLTIARIVMCERDGYDLRWQFVPLLAGMIKQFKLW